MGESPAGLHEDIFICLDIFRLIVHTITKRSTPLEAWLTFLSATDIHSITSLVKAFPMFLPIYQEIADFAQNPKELMNMFSEALRIMDHNLERMMVEEIRKECEAKVEAEVEARVKAEAKLKAAKTEFKAMADERINAIIEAKAQETNKAEIFRRVYLGNRRKKSHKSFLFPPTPSKKFHPLSITNHKT